MKRSLQIFHQNQATTFYSLFRGFHNIIDFICEKESAIIKTRREFQGRLKQFGELVACTWGKMACGSVYLHILTSHLFEQIAQANGILKFFCQSQERTNGQDTKQLFTNIQHHNSSFQILKHTNILLYYQFLYPYPIIKQKYPHQRAKPNITFEKRKRVYSFDYYFSH